MNAILLSESDAWTRVYGPAQLARLKEMVGLEPRAFSLADAPDATFIFSTWGMPTPDADEIARRFPNLKAVFYAAGSVQRFARPFLARGVRIFSAWRANAVPVSEFTLAQILLAAKGYFPAQAAMRTSRAAAADIAAAHCGMYDVKIGLLGCGAIGRMVAERLRAFACAVWVYDPFVSDDVLRLLGARRATMEDIFEKCDIVSNHLANLPATRGIITRAHLFSMRENATLINTGRGAQICETDLFDMLKEKPSVTALLDVLQDEANSDSNLLNALPNCFLTPHIAGSMGNEVRRMADYMIDECARFCAGEVPVHEVTLQMLETMA